MTVDELIRKLRKLPNGHDVIVQSRSDGEWGSFSVRSPIQSIVTRKVDDGSAVVIRCSDKWHSSGGFS